MAQSGSQSWLERKQEEKGVHGLFSEAVVWLEVSNWRCDSDSWISLIVLRNGMMGPELLEVVFVSSEKVGLKQEKKKKRVGNNMKCKILFLKTCVWGPGFW